MKWVRANRPAKENWTVKTTVCDVIVRSTTLVALSKLTLFMAKYILIRFFNIVPKKWKDITLCLKQIMIISSSIANLHILNFKNFWGLCTLQRVLSRVSRQYQNFRVKCCDRCLNDVNAKLWMGFSGLTTNNKCTCQPITSNLKICALTKVEWFFICTNDVMAYILNVM